MSTAEFYLPGDIKWGIVGKKGMPRGHGQLSSWGVPLYDRIQRARVMSQPEKRYGILPSMMSWAETAAAEENISREQCDEWALASHQKALTAIESGSFDDELIPISVPQLKGEPIIINNDGGPRKDTRLNKLSRIKPVLGGVCTAGNSSFENDGAAAVIVMSADKALELGLKPFCKIKSFAVVGDDPRRAYATVPKAVSRALAQADLALSKIDLIEIQEAFAD
jgi:acetyl-CoA C-acetyltransferase